MKKFTGRLLSGACAFAMTASLLTGCGGGTAQLAANGGTDASTGAAASDSSTDAAATADSEPITITVFSQLANYSGEQTGWSADVLKEKFNVVINIVPDLSGALSTRMESGNLGDIVVWGDNGTSYQNAIEAGLLYDWHEDNLVEEYGPNIVKYFSNAMDFNASYSGGTTYGIGHALASNNNDLQDFFYTWDIRWDLYKEIGYPEVNELEDLIDVFVKMKEACPTDDNGNPTYAVSLWPDWDGDMVMYVKSTATAFLGYDELGIGLYDPTTGDYYDCLMDDGPYYRALKFYNQLYQKGLLDPDSMTATYDTMSEKVSSGGTFFSIFNYAGDALFNTPDNLAAGRAMYPLTPKNATPIVYGMSTLGGNRLWTIGAKTDYPELCMQIIDYLCTPEGRMVMEYGPQGETWDYDENGGLVLTDLGKKTTADVETPMDEAGHTGTFHDGQLQINNITWALDAVNPDSAIGDTFNWKSWKSSQLDPQSDIEADWRNFTGCNTFNEYMLSGGYRVSPASTFVGSTRSEEFTTKWTQTTKCITTGTWNAIYANDDAEFQSIWEKMKQEANDYYYQECLEWSQNEAAIRHQCELDLGLQ